LTLKNDEIIIDISTVEFNYAASMRRKGCGYRMNYSNDSEVKNCKILSSLGIGMASIQNVPDDELEHIVRRAIVNGVNVFDLCAGGRNVFAPVGRAVSNVREKVFLTAHFGAGFDELGEYEWIREPAVIRREFRNQLKALGTDYIDIGLLHCVDDEQDWLELRDGGVLAYMRRLKKNGVLRSIGFSTHTPSLAIKMLESGEFDVVMANISDEYDDGMRDELLRKCLSENIPVLATGVMAELKNDMKLCVGGCICKALKRPGVKVALAGVRTIAELDKILCTPCA